MLNGPKMLKRARVNWSRSLTLKLGYGLLVLMTVGCTAGVGNIKPQIYLPDDRPVLKVEDLCDKDPEWCSWLGSLVEAQVRNCTTLAVLRGVNPDKCVIQ